MTVVERAIWFAAAVESAAGRLAAPALRRTLERRNLRSRDPVTGDAPVVVSLTSFGDRLRSVHLTIESIGRGALRPRRLILWIDDTEQLDALPAPLQRLRDRGLELRLTPDIGPYKKIVPTLAELGSEDPRPWIVTADDDVLYPREWLATLLDRAQREPGALHCYRARTVTVADDGLAPYADWRLCVSGEPGFHHIATGVSGVCYPPALQDALIAAGDAYLERAPRADDLWTHHMAVSIGMRIRQVSRRPRHFPEIPRSQRVSLFSDNLRRGGNDPQIRATYSAEAVARIRSDAGDGS